MSRGKGRVENPGKIKKEVTLDGLDDGKKIIAFAFGGIAIKAMREGVCEIVYNLQKIQHLLKIHGDDNWPVEVEKEMLRLKETALHQLALIAFDAAEHRDGRRLRCLAEFIETDIFGKANVDGLRQRIMTGKEIPALAQTARDLAKEFGYDIKSVRRIFKELGAKPKPDKRRAPPGKRKTFHRAQR